MTQNVHRFPAGARADVGVMDQQRMLAMLLDNLDGMVYRCRDDSEWTMEFISEGCLRLTGFPAGDLLRTACADAARIPARHPVTVSVNISKRQFCDERFAAILREILGETGLDPRRLELEITESLMMKDAERTAAMLNEVNALGVEIAVDDFGTGYSGLAQLKRFPVDRLKIDQSFVRDLTQDPNDAFIVQAILSLGRALGLRVVAEGVETAEQLAFLRQHGCDEVQGYYLGMPAPAEDYPDFFAPLPATK